MPKTRPALQLLPAVDVFDGQAVRLVQGKAGSEIVYDAPSTRARSWVEQGAEWIHLVDGRRFLARSNATTIGEVVNELKGQVRIELSGESARCSLAAALATGCTRVIWNRRA